MKHIFLTGFMGTGKTTISKALREILSCDVIDMDREIERMERMSIPEIFVQKGETWFRQCETSFLEGLKKREGAIVSCGGGVPLRRENVKTMRACGIVVLLTASPETIYERVKDSNDRPVLNGRKNVAGISELMEQRREKYEAAADIVVNTDGKSVLQVCEEMIQKLTEMEEE